MGLRLALVTNSADVVKHHAIINKFDLAKHFDAIVISADVGYRKPDSRIFAEVSHVTCHVLSIRGDISAAIVSFHEHGNVWQAIPCLTIISCHAPCDVCVTCVIVGHIHVIR